MAKKAAAKKSDESAPKSSAAVAPAADYVVMARRFRPGTFADVVGQAPTTNALKQALRTGRVAQAYLFCGPRGVGKTSLARIVAKALNCAKADGANSFAEEPCNACPACESIQDGSSLDVIEMDAATNRGIEEVRELRDSVGISPAELRYKVYIIDEVHMLTREAWNAFLKTLEEPPPRVKFIFATTDPNDVPETILSRCQRYDLRRINTKDIIGRLRQICETDSIQFEEAALSRIASLAKGGLRDAEGLLDQAVNLGQGKVADATVRDLSGAAPDELIFDLLHDCAGGNAGAALLKVHQALEAGADPEDMLAALCERLRGGLLCKTCGADSALLEGQSHLKEQYQKLAATFSDEQMLMLTQLFLQARRQLKDATQSRLPLEMAVVRAAKAKDLIDLGKLASALEHAPRSAPQASSGIAQSREGPRPNGPSRPAVAEPQRTAEPSTRTEADISVKPPPALVTATGKGEAVSAEDWQRVVGATAKQKGAGAVVGAVKLAADVRIDAESGTLILGFTPDLLLYLDLLEKPQSRSLLAAAVEEALGRSLNLALQRVATATRAPVTSVPMARSVPPAIQRRPVSVPPSQARPNSAPAPTATSGRSGGVDDGEPDMIVGDSDEVSDEEYTETGALPMNAPATGARDEDLAPQSNDDDDGPPAPSRKPVAPPVVKPTAYVPSTIDVKTVEDNPVVKMVLKETQGTIVRVTKR